MQLKVGDILVHKVFQPLTIIRLTEKVIMGNRRRSPRGFRYKTISKPVSPGGTVMLWEDYPHHSRSCYEILQFFRPITESERVLFLTEENI